MKAMAEYLDNHFSRQASSYLLFRTFKNIWHTIVRGENNKNH